MVSIRKTVKEDASILSKIQKEAFKSLYEKYHDEGNPYLRDENDILSRLGKQIARTAIKLCEENFTDATKYFVDFPEDLEMNRRCYESAGYVDTGKRLKVEENLTLACFTKWYYILNF